MNKQYYDKRVKQIKKESPRIKTFLMALSITKKIKDLDRLWATAAAVTMSFSSSLLSQDHLDLSLINA